MEISSVDRADRGNTGTAQENQEFSQPKESFEQKPNKKDKYYGHTSESKVYKNSKKSTNAETGAENIYNKEFKNISHKKSNGKTYNKKYNKHNVEQKINHEESEANLDPGVEITNESIHKRFSPSSKVTDSASSERCELRCKSDAQGQYSIGP